MWVLKYGEVTARLRAATSLWGSIYTTFIAWSMNGQFVFNNNTDWVSGNEAGTGNIHRQESAIQAHSRVFGMWKLEIFRPLTPLPNAAYLPTCSGNVYNDAVKGTITEVAPSALPVRIHGHDREYGYFSIQTDLILGAIRILRIGVRPMAALPVRVEAIQPPTGRVQLRPHQGPLPWGRVPPQ